MNEATIRKAIAACPKGANVKVVIERPVKLRAAYKGLPLFKRTEMTVRIGVVNDNRAAVKEARENGDRPAENQGLKGKEWIDAPILMRAIANPNQLYIRLEPSSNVKERCEPVFSIHEAGKTTVVEKADYVHMMLGSETKKSTYDGCFDVGIERVKRLHTVDETETEDEAEVEA